MKKNIWKIIIICSLLCIFVCLIQIIGLKQEVQNLKNNLSHQISSMESSLLQNSSYIENILKEEASILAKAEWHYGSFDAEKQTVEVVCSITPKEYDPAKTMASIMIANEEIPMTLENKKYVVTTQVSLFEETAISQVMFQEDGMIRSEGLEWSLMPLYEYLPMVNAYLNGSGTSSSKNGKYYWNRGGTLQVYVDKKGEDSYVESITIVRCLDGEETERIEVPIEENVQYMSDYFHEVNLSYQIPFGSVQDIYVDVVDGFGLRYRVCIDHTPIDEEGHYIDDQIYPENSEPIIYDQKGKELYRGYW